MKDQFSAIAKRAIAICIASSLSACALSPPSFDIPLNDYGVPITRSITDRIQCELVYMMSPSFPERPKIIQDDYVVTMLLSVGTTDKAGLNPSVNFPFGPKLSFDLNANADLSREDTLSIRLNYSMRELLSRANRHPEDYDCPAVDTNLAGDLGLVRSVRSALNTDGLAVSTEAASDGGEFSGTINFIATKAITSAGPTWMFGNFVGPKDLISVSRVTNNKLFYGFAAGANAGKPLSFPFRRAQTALDRQLTLDLGNQLAGIRNGLRP